jgi:hypothetical protein
MGGWNSEFGCGAAVAMPGPIVLEPLLNKEKKNMKRREFVAASCLAGLAPLGAVAQAAGSDDSAAKDFYELRLYHLGDGAKLKPFEDFVREAAIPALNRAGIEPVGVFGPAEGDDPYVYVLLRHKSLESAATVTQKLGDDAQFM